MIGMYSGIKIIKNNFITEIMQYKFPKKKKNRRWTKKYQKKYMKVMPSPKMFYLKQENVIFCHPVYFDKIVRMLKHKGLLYTHKEK